LYKSISAVEGIAFLSALALAPARLLAAGDQ
jgi:hypothetical protein